MFAALHTYKVSFFDYISYVVLEDNGDSSEEYDGASSRVKVQVGDVVELKEISDPYNNSFAMIKAIITHKANDG